MAAFQQQQQQQRVKASFIMFSPVWEPVLSVYQPPKTRQLVSSYVHDILKSEFGAEYYCTLGEWQLPVNLTALSDCFAGRVLGRGAVVFPHSALANMASILTHEYVVAEQFGCSSLFGGIIVEPIFLDVHPRDSEIIGRMSLFLVGLPSVVD